VRLEHLLSGVPLRRDKKTLFTVLKRFAINDHYSKSIEGEASSQQAVKSCSLRQRRTSWFHQLQESKKRRAESLKLFKKRACSSGG
jgi:hypothetical protein